MTEPDDPAWELLSEETAYRNRFHVLSRTYRLPDGTETDYEVIQAPQVAVVLCVTEDDHVVVARQFRAGPNRYVDELPGGCVEPGEDHADGAARELLEETGYAGDMRYVGTTWQAANSTMQVHVYACTNAKRVASPDLDEGEFVEPRLLSLDEFRAHARGGQFTDVAAAYMALDALGLLSPPTAT